MPNKSKNCFLKKQKSLFSGLKKSSSSMSQIHSIGRVNNSYQSERFQGNSLQRRPRGRGQ